MKLNFTYGKWQRLLLLFVFFGISNQAGAANYFIKTALTGTSVTPLDWTVASNWAIGSAAGTAATVAPTSGDTVNILAGKYVFIDANVNCAGLIITGTGTNANLYVRSIGKLNCTSISITGGAVIFITGATVSSEIVCSGIITCGTGNTTATKGVITMISSAKITCSKLTMGGALSLINGRNTSCTFEFTGNGTDVIPALPTVTTTSLGTDPMYLYVFNVVNLNPGVGNTISIPANFCAQSINVLSGTTNFGTNWLLTYNPNGTDDGQSFLGIQPDSKLQIGGDAKLPKYTSYDFKPTSTIEYNGIQQNIANPAVGYKNLILSGTGRKILDGSTAIYVSLTINNGVILELNSKNLTLNCRYNYIGTGSIRSTAASNISYAGDANASFQFDQSIPGTTNVVKNLTIGGTTYTPSGGSPLDVTIVNSLNIKNSVLFNAGHLVSNGNVTFKSNASTTAFVGPISDTSICGIIGNVNIERFIPATRAYRPLSSSVTGGTIFSNWQENGSVATLTGSILGNTLTTTDPSTPLAVGQHISGNLIPANTLITNIDNATSNVYEISMPIQNVVTPRFMYATSGIGSTVVIARFTGQITSNILSPTLFTVGTTLAIGQMIKNGTSPNTVITADNGDGTYTIGQEIPSQNIHYNGAQAGFGTHVTGLSCTDAQLGQYDSATGLDYTRSGNPSLFTYSNNSQVFGQVMSTKATNLSAGNPYLMMIRGDRTIDLALNASTATDTTLRSTGTIVAGPVDVSLSLNQTASTGTTPNYNFVGNPYQAPVDLSLIYESGTGTRWVNLGTSYTVFDTKANTRGAYVTYDFDIATATISGDTDPSSLVSAMTNILQPNQAFFVTTTAATPTLVFNETDKDISSNVYVPMFRSTQNTTSKIKGSICNAATSKALDGFVIAFGDSFNNTIVAEDTRKMLGNQDETFASTNDVNKMAIDKRNFPSEADEIPLSITQYRLTNYVMKFNVSNFDQMDAYLVDTYTATETTLNNNEINSYPFTVDTSIPASIAENRFKIVFRNSALQTNSNSISAFAVYPNPVVDNKFTIKSNQAFSGKDANVNIINSLGQKVFSFNGAFSTDGSLLVNPTVALSKGIYLVKVAVEGKVETKKLIIK